MNPKLTPKQNLVRRYIIGKLFPACGKDPLPLNELAIARKFGVNRLTVRKVSADLVQDHSLITLPGRRGLFINPEYVRMRGARRFIGVIGPTLQMPLIENINFRILSAFDSAMEDCDGDYNFLTFATKDPDEIADEILASPLTGLLWLMPNADMLPVFEKVVEAGVAAVAVAPSFYDDWKPPRSNAVLYDNVSGGRYRARIVLRNGVTRPGYLSIYTLDAFAGFCQEFRAAGLSYGKEYFCPIQENSWPKLRRWIRTGKIDSLVMDGSIMPFFHDFHTAVPELKQIPLFINHSPRTRLIQSIDPDLRLIFIRHTVDRTEYAGKTAATMMMQLLQSGGGQLENRVIQIPEENPFPTVENKRKNKAGGIVK